ncbi:MAG: type II toxin-antitoxin system Phd/YefM family antitoxin [Chloroflexi bacterium]|nr:type II toxin-antitoxin system Phd/YefM family antitoxin [Chloroflexota bacterium]
MPVKYLPATEVKNRFGRVLREVARTGGPIYVERGGKPVAVILDVRAYERICREGVPPAGTRLEEAAFGMWAGRDDMGDEWVAEGRKRWESDWKREQTG